MAQGVYERVKAKQKAESEGKFSGAYDRAKAKNTQFQMFDISKRLESIQPKIEQVYKSYNTRFYDENGNFVNSYRGDTKDAFDSFNSQKSSLDNDINYINSFLSENEKYLNSEYVSSIKNYLSGNSKSLSDMHNAYKSDSDYWSQWATEQDYNGYLLNDTTGYTTDDIEMRKGIYGNNTKRIAELDELIKNFKYDNEGSWGWTTNADSNIPVPSYTVKAKNQSEYDALVAERDKLKAQNQIYARGNKVNDDIFATYAGSKDYATQSKNRDYSYLSKDDIDVIKGIRQTELNRLSGNSLGSDYEYDPNNYIIEDPLGTYLNASEEDIYWAIENGGSSVDVVRNYTKVLNEGDIGGWRHLKEEEIGMYYYLWNKGLKDEAKAYLKGMETELDRRANAETQEKLANASALELVFHNIASIPVGIIGGAVGFVNDALTMASGEEINPYGAGHNMQNYSQGVRGVTASKIDAATGNFELLGTSFGDAYQSVMSGLDSLAGAVTFGGGYTVLMGMGAASSEAKRLYEQGASNEQIAAGGILAGATEMIFEKVSIDHFLDKFVNAPTMNWKQLVAQTLMQGGIEATEEVCTEIANTISNTLLMGSQSDWAQSIEKYKNEGYSDSEAIQKALQEIGGNVWDAGVGGLISGIMLGGGGSAINLIQNKTDISNQNKKDGADIVGNNNVEGLLAAVRNLPNTKANAKIKALAEDMGKIDTTKLSKAEYKRFSERVGKLYSLVQNAQVSKLSTSKSDAAKSIITEKLNSLGVENESDISKATEAIFNTVYKGKKLSASESKLLDRIGATKVVNELMNESSDVNAEAIKSWDRAKGQLRETQSLTNKTDSRTIDTSSYSLSDDGKTYIKGTDEAVSITGIQSIKNGDIKVNLSNGKTESISNIDLGSQDDAVIYQGILDMGVDSATASLIVKSFEKGTDATSYIYGVQDAIKYGKIGGKAYVNSGVFTSKLTDKQRSDFYRVGEMATERAAQNKAKAIENAKKDNKVKGKVIGNVSFDGVDRNSLNERQRVTVDAIEAAFGEMGINVVFFQSPVNAQGEHIGENGSYDPETNTIRLDISAGLRNQDTILFTAAHELTHFIAAWSKDKFKVFSDFLIENYAKHGVSVDDLVRAKIENSKKSNTYSKPLTYDEAFEEVVADSCESFLRDSDLMPKLVELAKKDMTLFERIKDYIDGLFDRLKKAYAGLTPDSLEANEVLAMKDCIGELRKMWVEAAMEAKENFQAAGGKALKNTTSEGGVKFELREYSQHQIDNWKNSKKIVLYENETQFRNFIKESQTNKQYHKKLYFGAIPSDFAQFIFENTAVDVEGYNCSLSSDEIRKIFKDHGTEETEAPRGQRAITDDDIVNILLVLQSPEVVARSEKDYMGKPVINMSKHIDGKMTISAVVSDKHLDLFVQTAFVGIKKGNLVTPIAEQAAINTPKASSDTVSKDSIPQPSKKSQEKKSDRTIETVNNTVFGEKQIDVGKTESGVKYQLRENAKISKAAIDYNNKHMNVEAAILTTGVEMMHEMAEVMLPYLEEEGILPPDIPGKTIFKNGSYGRTGENTTLCVRTLTYEDFKDRVSEKIGRPLTVSESLLVSQKIYDIATEPQCIYCYVAADRKAYDGYLGEYWTAMDKYIKALKKGGDPKALYEEYLNGRKDTAQQQKRWASWVALAKSGKAYISQKDLTTKLKRELIIAKKNALSEQVKDAQRYAQSASWAKTVYDYRAYKGDILKMSQKFVEMLNSEYGLRMYSFSDYTPAFIVENMQMIIDAAVKGLKSLAYTKDTDYAEIFAPTGQAINVSCFAKYDLAKKTYVEDNRQGANWAKTKELRNKFNNVGAVMVCTSDEMVMWALKQDWVDVVIPYHIVKTGTTIANEYGWNNYTSESADKVNGKVANIYPTKHNNSFATYSKLIKERGITPRFSRYYAMVDKGEITRQQYMKLVNEVRLPASKLSAVKPVFNLDAAKKSFGVDNDGNVIKGGFVDKGGYMGGWYRQGVDVNQEVLAVAKDIEMGKSSLDVDYGMSKASKEKVEAKYGIKRSDRDSSGNTLSPELIEFFRDSKVRDDNGNLLVCSHSSPSKFTSFDKTKIGEGLNFGKGFYFFDHIPRSIPKQYGENQYLCYLNIVNPAILDDANELSKVLTKLGFSDFEHLISAEYDVADVFEELGVYQEDIADTLANVGYDGIWVKDSNEVVAFEPNQIKSADPITYDDNGNVIPLSERFNSKNDDIRYQARPTESVSNRSLLANALEGAVQNEVEKTKLAEYKNNIDRINAEEKKLAELRKQIHEMSFKPGKRDAATQEKLRKLRDEALRSTNRISLYDKKLLTLEASKPLMDVLKREKAKAVERQKTKDAETMAAYRQYQNEKFDAVKKQYQESRQKAVEGRHRTELRNKIKRVVNDLNQYLLKGNKDKHVMIGLQKSVAMALDAVNMDTVGADERVAKYNALIAKATDPDVKASLIETRDRIQQMGDRMNDKLDKLKSAYEEIKNSKDPDVANAYDEVIENAINFVITDVGETSLRDMTYDQLESVYDLYTMILTRVRGANESFKSAKNEDIRTRGSRVATEVERTGGSHPLSIKALGAVKGFAWNTLKPTYAFETIGSETLTEAFENVRSGEDTWATDVNEAKDYYKEKTDKYGFDSWDFKTRHTFKSTSGISFELSLEQIMSLYAFSKRKQAGQHLQYGGFVFDDSIEVVEKKHGVPIKYTVNTANAHNLSIETLSEIIGKLTPEQKTFVDEMQEYLSAVMGAKGNEVSLAMYGVKLFKEKFYFPLRSANQFMFEQNQTVGEVRIKNAGFTKETNEHANNPIILSNFTDVWANHVNDMAMYHSFVLALEDFNRIFNYKTPSSDENFATTAVKSAIQNAYGKQATDYIKQLITDLNGGARVDSATGFLNKTIGMFKKASVFASASVVVQQPSAIGRAFAIIDPKYFATNPGIKGHKDLWEEVKKYAPVAIIKEMGYFDTHVGKQTTDWIKAKEYHGIKDKAKALVTDSGYRDDILSKAPALADELTWSYIWQAVKKEVAATTDLKVGSEEYLQRCGKRFTEVITKTQVYDSVLARSGMMRSNDTGMKMVTAFMAEPTTSLNMLTNALVQGKRGNKRYARKAIGGVVTSMVLNSILVALVYAARDDDEDETYLEKYVSAFSGQMADSINPITLIPWVKDIWSIVQGYDVERSDMSVISDLWNAFSDLTNENKSAYRKVEDFVGSVSSIFGLPAKNIMRDARSIYNVVDTFMNGGKTTWYGIEDAIIEGVTGKDVSLMERAERAMSRGDSKTFSKTVSEMIQAKVDAGKTEKEAKSAVRSSFTSRYKKLYVEAAKKHNSAEMTRIRKLLYQTGVYGTLTELDETLKKWRTE